MEENNDNNKRERKATPYFDNYKARYEKHMWKKREERQRQEKLGEIITNNPEELKEEKKPENKSADTIIKEVEETLELRRGPRWEKTLIVAIYAIVLLIIVYLVMASFFPSYLPFSGKVYTISAGDNPLLNPLSSFYIDRNVLGDKLRIDGKMVRPIISAQPFNLVFVPKTNIGNTNATLELNFVLNGSGSKIYLNNQLIFPSLENYTLAYENNRDYVYVRDDLGNHSLENNVNSSEEFIYKNLPGASAWSTRKLNPVDVKLSDYKQENTRINTTFRDNLNLAVYAEGSLDINFTKQDLNNYLGQDEYTINVTDSSGNVIFSQAYADDGDKLADGRLGIEQYFSIGLDNLGSEIYYISFIKDNFNQYSDSTIKNIKINSNKILILGDFLPIRPFNFYIKNNQQSQIGFYYWLDGKDQVITENNRSINLSVDLFNKKHNENLNRGEYNFSIQKGYLWVYSDRISPSKEDWFELPFKQQNNFANQDVLVISKDNFNIDFGELKFVPDIALTGKTQKIGLRILDANKINFESAKLTLD
jgi:hypothetical protein